MSKDVKTHGQAKSRLVNEAKDAHAEAISEALSAHVREVSERLFPGADPPRIGWTTPASPTREELVEGFDSLLPPEYRPTGAKR